MPIEIRELIFRAMILGAEETAESAAEGGKKAHDPCCEKKKNDAKESIEEVIQSLNDGATSGFKTSKR